MSTRQERNQRTGKLRQQIVADILAYIYKQEPETSVYTITNTHSLLDPKVGGGTQGDKFYIYREGYTIVNRPGKKRGPDILVYKDGKRKSAWEITNYAKGSYMLYPRLYRYIKNLSKFDCDKILLVSYPDNFRHMHPDKTDEYNIEWTEKFLAKKRIFVVYMGHQDIPIEEEIEGWKE